MTNYLQRARSALHEFLRGRRDAPPDGQSPAAPTHRARTRTPVPAGDNLVVADGRLAFVDPAQAASRPGVVARRLRGRGRAGTFRCRQAPSRSSESTRRVSRTSAPVRTSARQLVCSSSCVRAPDCRRACGDAPGRPARRVVSRGWVAAESSMTPLADGAADPHALLDDPESRTPVWSSPRWRASASGRCCASWARPSSSS